MSGVPVRAFRQLRGHIGVVATPTTCALVAVLVVVIAARARNAPMMLGAAGGQVDLTVAAAVRIGVLQMSTLAGVAVAAAGAASFPASTADRRGEEQLALLEPSGMRRWAGRFLAVLVLILVAAIAAAVAVFAVGFLQALRLPGPIRVHWGDSSHAAELVARSSLPAVTFAAVAVLLAATLRSNPAVVAACAIAGTYALLLLQHLLGRLGDLLVPTAWVGRWLHLTGDEHGIGYLWTTGAFGGQRLAAGAALTVVAICLSLGGWSVIARAPAA